MVAPAILRLLCPEDRLVLGELGAPPERLPRHEFLNAPKSGLTRDGSLYGSFSEGGTYLQATAEFAVGRLVLAKVEVDVAQSEDLEPLGEAVAAHWGLSLARKGKGRRFQASGPAKASVPGTVRLEVQAIDTGGDPIFRVTVSATVDDPDALRSLEPPVPIEQVAAVVASAELPPARCRELLTAHWESGARGLLPDPLRAALAALPREQLRERTKALLRLVDEHLRAEPTAFADALGPLEPSEKSWLRLDAARRHALTTALEPVLPRATVVELLVDGLDFGDGAAVTALCTAMARARSEPNARLPSLSADDVRLGDPDEQQDRVVAVLTAGLSPRALAEAGRHNGWPVAAALARALTPHVGAPPDFTTAQVLAGLGKRAEREEGWRRASVARARWLAQARRVDEALFKELLKTCEYDEAAAFLTADEANVAPAAAGYRFGTRVVTYKRSSSGKQLVTTADFPDEATARAKLGGKKLKAQKKRMR